jgi:type IV pilus assembly protein PilA
MEKSITDTGCRPQGEGIPSRTAGHDGFTLVELLVVVIIVGILATIAIPAYTSQRDRAYESAVQADLRNAGTLQVSQLQSGSSPVANLAGLSDLGFRPSRGVEIVNDGDFLDGPSEFCIVARPEQGSGQTWAVSSDDGLRVIIDESC